MYSLQLCIYRISAAQHRHIIVAQPELSARDTLTLCLGEYMQLGIYRLSR